MKSGLTKFLLAALIAFITASPAMAQGGKRVKGDFRRSDANGDNRLSPAEWHRRGHFRLLDTDNDGFLSLPEVRAMYRGHRQKDYDWPPAGFRRSSVRLDPSAERDVIAAGKVDGVTRCAIVRGRGCSIHDAVKRGLMETGLGPVFPPGAICHPVDDHFAIDYTFKRNNEAYHGGIDIPARWGEPMLAVADGTVVGVFEGEESKRGMEIVLRHAPEDTGLPVWTYTGYGHLDRLPDLKYGQRMKKGDIIGPTGNSGLGGRGGGQSMRRRPAIHFSAFSSASRKFTIYNDIIVPIDGIWMDPMALYRGNPQVDSRSLKSLPASKKGIPMAIKFKDGSFSSPSSKVIWPYNCRKK